MVDAELTLLVVRPDGEIVASEGDAEATRRIASVGKLLLLGYVGELLDVAGLEATEMLSRNSVEPIADSGLWQHLDVDQLSIADCCRLVGAVSDNLATNVLLQRVGIGNVQRYAVGLGVAPYVLHDQIRNRRTPDLPHTFAEGSASSLVRFLRLLHDGAVSSRVRDWMSLNTDLSMSAGHLQLDPLAHVDGIPLLINKTGTDDGVRVDVGTVTSGDRVVHYCAMLHWDQHRPMPPEAFEKLRGFGARIAAAVSD